MINSQLGYSASVTSTTPTISTTLQNLVSVTIPSAGVWLVEGQLYATITTSTSFNISLSTTSATRDDTRVIVRYIPGPNSTWADHITSVFTLTSSTTIYLVGQTPGGSSTNNSNIIRYTKIG